MALSRDKRSLLLTVAAMLGVVAFFQIVGYGRLVGTGGGGGGGEGRKQSPSSSYDVGRRIAHHQQSMGPEGRACLTHICVFFDVTFDGELGGRIIFLLYEKKVPLCFPNFACSSCRVIPPPFCFLVEREEGFHNVRKGDDELCVRN
jgi:hypothetical protein